MEKEKVINYIDVSDKMVLRLYSTFFQVHNKKGLFSKKKDYQYADIGKITVEITKPEIYVKSEGLFLNLHIEFKKKGFATFDFYEYNVKQLKYHTSKVIAFVGAMKACISGMVSMNGTSFYEKTKEVIIPEIVVLEPEESNYRLMLENKNQNENDIKLIE